MSSLDPAALQDIIKNSGLSYKETRMSFIFTCPKCNKGQKLYIRKYDGRFTCWSCSQTDGFYGQPEYALAALLMLPAKAFQAQLYGVGEVPLTEFWSPNITDWWDNESAEDKELYEDLKVSNEVHLPSLMWPVDTYPIMHAKASAGLQYLEGRGISWQLAHKYGVRYSARRNRVYFPLCFEGRLYGWQARTTRDDMYFVESEERWVAPIKILSSDDIPRASHLMFSERLNGSEHAVLCEGPIDAIKADLCDGNVCSMGKCVTPVQFGSLLNAGIRKIYLALDPDAIDEARYLMEDYCDEADFYLMQPPAGKKDIGELDPEHVLEIFKGAEKMSPAKFYSFIKKHF